MATLDAAHARFRGRLGLQSLIMLAAREGGYDGHDFKAEPREALRAAFSTFSLPGILSNVANKFLLDGFSAVESSWRQITAVRSVSDFKRVTSYRLTGGFEYQEVGPDGELKHAEVGEESFGNQARTYGRMFAITRTDLINDDLGALTVVHATRTFRAPSSRSLSPVPLTRRRSFAASRSFIVLPSFVATTSRSPLLINNTRKTRRTGSRECRRSLPPRAGRPASPPAPPGRCATLLRTARR